MGRMLIKYFLSFCNHISALLLLFLVFLVIKGKEKMPTAEEFLFDKNIRNKKD